MIVQSITNCLTEGEGYEEIDIEDIKITDGVSLHSNRCRVDGSLINLHLVRMDVFDAFI